MRCDAMKRRRICAAGGDGGLGERVEVEERGLAGARGGGGGAGA